MSQARRNFDRHFTLEVARSGIKRDHGVPGDGGSRKWGTMLIFTQN